MRRSDSRRGRPLPRVAVLEWTDPLFASGHWVPDLVEAAGAASVLGAAGLRSRQIEPHTVVEAAPDLVVVAPCGYNLAGAVEVAAALLDEGVVPASADVWAVDADAAFVRPGPRLVDGVETLAAIAHPDVMHLPAGRAAHVASR